MLEPVLYILIVISAIVLLIQISISLYQTLYIWDKPDVMRRSGTPKRPSKPRHGFTVLLPARHEAAVIGETLRKLSKARYPSEKLEFMVICTSDDIDTINAAKESARKHNIRNAKIVMFDGKPGKSRGMNIGLTKARHNIITIFDSEDDVSPDIFKIANTLFCKKRFDVLQCGVQLMDYDNSWFGTHNVLEYFFWFKSRMHYYATKNSVPLGGNTVFFKKAAIEEVGGWDEDNLTEDADIGIRLSVLQKKFGAMYAPKHVTKEECPHDTKSIHQATYTLEPGFYSNNKER
jgi:glycosyltransferase XagB